MIFYPTPTTPTTLKSSVVGVVGVGCFFINQSPSAYAASPFDGDAQMFHI